MLVLGYGKLPARKGETGISMHRAATRILRTTRMRYPLPISHPLEAVARSHIWARPTHTCRGWIVSSVACRAFVAANSKLSPQGATRQASASYASCWTARREAPYRSTAQSLKTLLPAAHLDLRQDPAQTGPTDWRFRPRRSTFTREVSKQSSP